LTARARTSAAADIWIAARATGALSVPAYHRSLETASILDVGRAALERLQDAVGEREPSTAEALAALGDARLLQIAVCAAGARVQHARRRALVDPSVATPPPLDRAARLRLDRLRATMAALDPAANPLVGALAGTERAATRALVETEPLFTDRTLASAAGSITFDEIELLVDALHETLVVGFRHVVVQQSVPVRALARGQRLVGRVRRGR
jgi:hypothetical protein